MSKLIFLFTALLLLSCEGSSTYSQSMSNFSYDLSQPTLEVKLDKDLRETSALSLSSNKKQLLTLNDEEGKLFFLNKQTGEIEEEIKFEKKGDYEGVEAVGDRIYAVTSSGDLYEIELRKDKKPKVEKYETSLKSSNDIEGLCYDSSSNQLLIACKARHKDYKEERVVFGFDLVEKELKEKAIYRVNHDSLYQFIDQYTNINSMISRTLAKTFAPSGIAVHPISKEVYLLSSPGKVLVVLDAKGAIKSVQKLSPKFMKQPEGICFDTDATLYISSEGDGGKGRLLRYDYLK
ncbi:MAG: SdiA-regulated domain-containing protein [Bacteroidota bacterium]